MLYKTEGEYSSPHNDSTNNHHHPLKQQTFTGKHATLLMLPTVEGNCVLTLHGRVLIFIA